MSNAGATYSSVYGILPSHLISVPALNVEAHILVVIWFVLFYYEFYVSPDVFASWEG